MEENKNLNKGQEFYNLLQKNIVSDIQDEEINKKNIDELGDWLIANLPKRLFRYRTINEYSINALENDKIWGTRSHLLNDIFEGSGYYNLPEIADFFDNQFFKATKKDIDNIANSAINDDIPLFIEKFIGVEQANNLKNIKEVNLDETIIEFGKIQIKQFLIDNLNDIIVEFYKQSIISRQYRNIACFTTDYKSMLMWGHYADGHRGFVLEYDFKEAVKKCSSKCKNFKNCATCGVKTLIAPVNYTDTRYDDTKDLTQYIVRAIFQHCNIETNQVDEDKLSQIKRLLIKSNHWSYENEWRMISKIYEEELTKDFEDYKCILDYRPKALYLGAFISYENEKMLREICERKNIKCYKMSLDYYNKGFFVETEDYIDSNLKGVLENGK